MLPPLPPVARRQRPARDLSMDVLARAAAAHVEVVMPSGRVGTLLYVRPTSRIAVVHDGHHHRIPVDHLIIMEPSS